MSDHGEISNKKRKIQRACDSCRKKKVKCDGPQNRVTNTKCSNCHEANAECTYQEESARRGPPKGYVETLEHRCKRLERIIEQLDPELDSDAYAGPVMDRDSFDLNAYRRELSGRNIPSFPSHKPLDASKPGHYRTADTSSNNADTPESFLRRFYAELSPAASLNNVVDEKDHYNQISVAGGMKRMGIRDEHWRYHGRSSQIDLVATLLGLQRNTAGRPKEFGAEVVKTKRPEFWEVPEWEVVVAQEGVQSVDLGSWPDKGLCQSMINAYFRHINIHLPLLDKKNFQNQYDAGKWRVNKGFAKLCLLVFACGSRFVDDARVLWPVEHNTPDGPPHHSSQYAQRQSAGWGYFLSFLRTGESIAERPSLLEIQCQVLTCQFLFGAALPHYVWTLAGSGLRSTQELGIHMRATLHQADPVQREMFTRAFWCLYHLDRLNSSIIGRTVAIQDSDFDLYYPSDVSGSTSGEASEVSVFVQLIKLDHVLGAALQTVYAQRASLRSTAMLQISVDQLNNALNAWSTHLPETLRWSPTIPDYVLFQQVSTLSLQYLYCRIAANRPLMEPSAYAKADPSSAFALSLEASRGILDIVNSCLARSRQEPFQAGPVLDISTALPIWQAAIIVLIDVYSSSRQTAQQRDASLQLVRVAFDAIQELEGQWKMAGKFNDMLSVLGDTEVLPSLEGGESAQNQLSNSRDNPAGRQAPFQSFANNAASTSSTRSTLANDAVPIPYAHSRNPSHTPPPRGGQFSGFLPQQFPIDPVLASQDEQHAALENEPLGWLLAMSNPGAQGNGETAGVNGVFGDGDVWAQLFGGGSFF
ncbi:hypothetical protein L202_06481 [Cryptococcus amylolentus CBS 6039]|uniref:Zn(2)-C6 fungal-type domain-containing protein n=1 Tax=Cryptococcus amylolentus CBS 6039 TaxID=1295533 RepID=A0A1E3HG12_9TREE|nr:hypothetical protein L202_06481 [Cryptococcus amylolentus CBS 6039]ODN75299.1 hypothetical protein L202_06481 [Cryptococcus amylolentus CBS 6039]